MLDRIIAPHVALRVLLKTSPLALLSTLDPSGSPDGPGRSNCPPRPVVWSTANPVGLAPITHVDELAFARRRHGRRRAS